MNLYLLLQQDYQILAFYPYTSITFNRILQQNYNYKTEEHDLLEEFWNKMWKKAEDLGCHFDNKIVLEIKPTIKGKHSSLFLGRKDGLISLGLSMTQDEWLEELKRNKYFI